MIQGKCSRAILSSTPPCLEVMILNFSVIMFLSHQILAIQILRLFSIPEGLPVGNVANEILYGI